MSVLLAQLTLVETGAQCGAYGSAAGRPDATAAEAHAAMGMGSVAARDAAASSEGQCSGREMPADHVPCNLPWAPGAACAQMTSCAAPMTVVVPDSALEPSQGFVQVIAPGAAVPTRPAAAPEPPPPRT